MAAISKVVYGNQTILDISQDSVSADTLLSGKTAHGSDGELVTGILSLIDNWDIHFSKKGLPSSIPSGGGVWVDDVNGVEMQLSDTYCSISNNRLVVSGQANLEFSVSKTSMIAKIRCKIPSTFTPRSYSWWWSASCILGCDQPRSAKDWGLVLDSSGNVGIGSVTSSEAIITDELKNILDDTEHELLLFMDYVLTDQAQNTVRNMIMLDGRIILVNSEVYSKGSDEITKLGVFWNAYNASSGIIGEISDIAIKYIPFDSDLFDASTSAPVYEEEEF